MGAVLQLRRVREVDVIARRTPGHRFLRDQVGTLYLDSYPNGVVYAAQFDPIFERLLSVQLSCRDHTESATCVTLVDADDGATWTFEVNDVEDYDDDDEDYDDEDL